LLSGFSSFRYLARELVNQIYTVIVYINIVEKVIGYINIVIFVTYYLCNINVNITTSVNVMSLLLSWVTEGKQDNMVIIDITLVIV